MRDVTFNRWLVRSFELANKRPGVWLGCVLFLAVILPLARISLALGIVLSISSLLIAVGVVGSIDQERPALSFAIKRQVPLALSFAVGLMLFWFAFRLVANIQAATPEKIGQFFFYWELSADHVADKVFRQFMVWLYSAAIVALIFVLLMFNTLGSWFSYPLMLFKGCSWGEARGLGLQASSEHRGTMYWLTGFLLLTAFVGMGLIPLLTPLFYMLVSTLMYVSYHDIFVKK